jgi:hypothetical protein
VPAARAGTTIRVALPSLPWPLDPGRLQTRDEQAVGRALLATPLRVVDGRPAPGLCSLDLRCGRWTRAVLRQLHRAGIPRSDRWRLTSVRAAPVGAPGPFRLVRGSPQEIVARRGSTTLIFVRMTPQAAVAAFRAGGVDEAPVPFGDIRALRGDPALHVRQILALDVVRLAPAVPLAVRRVYWETADRADYQALVPEYSAQPALGLVPNADASRSSPSIYRTAKGRVGELPKLAVRIATPPALRDAADIVASNWLELGLGPIVGARGSSRFLRVQAEYPQPGAIERQLGIEDAVAYQRALVVPLAWVADARLVSARLRGWAEDALGVPDYSRVR